MKTIAFIVLSIVFVAGLAGIAAWLAAPTTLPAADRVTFERANQLYQSGSYAEAISLYEQLISRGIANPDLFYNLGSAYSHLGNGKQAAEAFARAAELAPRDPQIAARLAEVGSAPSGFTLPVTSNERSLAVLVMVSVLAMAIVGGRRLRYASHMPR